MSVPETWLLWWNELDDPAEDRVGVGLPELPDDHERQPVAGRQALPGPSGLSSR